MVSHSLLATCPECNQPAQVGEVASLSNVPGRPARINVLSWCVNEECVLAGLEIARPNWKAWHESKIGHGKVRRLLTSLDFHIEMAASTFTVSGIYLGSTTVAGSICYLVSVVFWYWLIARKKLWGLIPLNVISTAICAVNLWKAAT